MVQHEQNTCEDICFMATQVKNFDNEHLDPFVSIATVLFRLALSVAAIQFSKCIEGCLKASYNCDE
jgi:hypothetical protein